MIRCTRQYIYFDKTRYTLTRQDILLQETNYELGPGDHVTYLGAAKIRGAVSGSSGWYWPLGTTTRTHCQDMFQEIKTPELLRSCPLPGECII